MLFKFHTHTHTGRSSGSRAVALASGLALDSGLGARRQDCNQKLRDHETRDNASKCMRHLSMYRVPVKHRLLEKYGRPECKASTLAAHVPDVQARGF